VANRPVSFRLYSSLHRTEDQIGDVVDLSAEPELHAHAPLQALIRFGKPTGERLVPVRLGAQLTAVGTLEIWCDSKISENRWRLQFELRKSALPTATRAATVIADEAVAQGEELIRQTFAAATLPPEELPAKLEQLLGLGRASWPLSVIRRFADLFLQLAEGRKRSAAHESRWLNLAGLCLRPGFGFPGDELRIEQARRVYAGGLAFGNQVQPEIEWWIFWGRVAGGLNRNQQTDIYQRIANQILPKGNKKAPRINPSLLRELWRTAASLEHLPAGTRTELGEACLKRLRNNQSPHPDTDLWCLSRLGARKLFYAPLNLVLPAATAARWAEQLAKQPHAPVPDTLVALCQKTGNATLDLPAATLSLAAARLRSHKDADALLARLEGKAPDSAESLARLFGEELPSGLVFASSY
jgi:hypothetical protein